MAMLNNLVLMLRLAILKENATAIITLIGTPALSVPSHRNDLPHLIHPDKHGWKKKKHNAHYGQGPQDEEKSDK